MLAWRAEPTIPGGTMLTEEELAARSQAAEEVLPDRLARSGEGVLLGSRASSLMLFLLPMGNGLEGSLLPLRVAAAFWQRQGDCCSGHGAAGGEHPGRLSVLSGWRAFSWHLSSHAPACPHAFHPPPPLKVSKHRGPGALAAAPDLAPPSAAAQGVCGAAGRAARRPAVLQGACQPGGAGQS